MKKILFVLSVVFLSFAPTWAQDDKQAYEGFYWNDDRSAIIELRLSGGTIEGVTAWGPPEEARDTHNPDQELQKRPIIGMTFLWGFEYSPKKNRWKNGKVYDPNNGKTYDAKMALKNGGKTLEMRGYIGVSLLGRTAKFERVRTENIPAGLLNAVRSTKAHE